MIETDLEYLNALQSVFESASIEEFSIEYSKFKAFHNDKNYSLTQFYALFDGFNFIEQHSDPRTILLYQIYNGFKGIEDPENIYKTNFESLLTQPEKIKHTKSVYYLFKIAFETVIELRIMNVDLCKNIGELIRIQKLMLLEKQTGLEQLPKKEGLTAFQRDSMLFGGRDTADRVASRDRDFDYASPYQGMA